MSRTFRTVSHRLKSFFGKDKVKDGSRTHAFGSCQNHGSCPWCKGNRLYKHKKQPVLEDFKEDL